MNFENTVESIIDKNDNLLHTLIVLGVGKQERIKLPSDKEEVIDRSDPWWWLFDDPPEEDDFSTEYLWYASKEQREH